MTLRNTAQKSIAFATFITFTTTSLSWAAPLQPSVSSLVSDRSKDGVEIPSLALSIELPESLGSIRNRYVPDRLPSDSLPNSSAPTVLYIQDAHGNYEAQRQISGMLDHLKQTYGLDLIFLEGGAGKINPDLLRFFKDETLNREFADRLMKRGLVTGPGLFLLEHGTKAERKPASVFGVEDLAVYRDHVLSFRGVYEKKSVSDSFLKAVKIQIATQKSLVLNHKLAKFFAEWLFYDDYRPDLLGHIQTLGAYAKSELNINLQDAREQMDWPQLVRIFKLRELEAGLKEKQTETEAEKTRLIQWINDIHLAGTVQDGLKRLLDPAKTGSSNEFDSEAARRAIEKFYEAAAPKGFSFKDYPNASRFLGIQILKSELDGAALFDEIARLTDRLLDRLAQTPEEKELISLYRDYLLLSKLFSLELDRGEYLKVKSRLQSFDPLAFLKRLTGIQRPQLSFRPRIRHSGESRNPVRDKLQPESSLDFLLDKVSERSQREGTVAEMEAIRSQFNRALHFYELALAREKIMFEKMLSAMKNQGKANAVLVTGGFHAEGLEAEMKARGISFAELMPRLSEAEGNQAYVDVMTLRGALPFQSSHVPQAALDKFSLGEIKTLFGRQYEEYYERVIKEVGSDLENPSVESPYLKMQPVQNLGPSHMTRVSSWPSSRSEVREDESAFARLEQKIEELQTEVSGLKTLINELTKIVLAGPVGGASNIRRWEEETPEETPIDFRTAAVHFAELKGHGTSVVSAAFSPDGRKIATGGFDTVRIWDSESGELLEALRMMAEGFFPFVSFSPAENEKTIVTTGKNYTVRVLNLKFLATETETGYPTTTLTGHTGWVDSASFSPDGGKIATSSSGDDTIRIWNAKSGVLLKTFTGDTSFVSYSPDGSKILTKGKDNTVRILDVETGELLQTLTGHTGLVHFASFSADGKKIASGNRDKTVHIWNAETGELLRTLTGHMDSVFSVSFSPDGKTIASASKDKTVRLWNVETGELLRTLTGHTDSVFSVSFSPNGRKIATASTDQTARIWFFSSSRRSETRDEPPAGGKVGNLFPLHHLVDTLLVEGRYEDAFSDGFRGYWNIAAEVAGNQLVTIEEYFVYLEGMRPVRKSIMARVRKWSPDTLDKIFTDSADQETILAERDLPPKAFTWGHGNHFHVESPKIVAAMAEELRKSERPEEALDIAVKNTRSEARELGSMMDRLEPLIGTFVSRPNLQTKSSIYETIDGILSATSYTRQDLERIRQLKLIKAGSFLNRDVLKEGVNKSNGQRIPINPPKAVRDKIVFTVGEVIEQHREKLPLDYKVQAYTASPEEFLSLLKIKLKDEEFAEVRKATGNDLIEELADLVEVMEAISALSLRSEARLASSGPVLSEVKGQARTGIALRAGSREPREEVHGTRVAVPGTSGEVPRSEVRMNEVRLKDLIAELDSPLPNVRIQAAKELSNYDLYVPQPHGKIQSSSLLDEVVTVLVEHMRHHPDSNFRAEVARTIRSLDGYRIRIFQRPAGEPGTSFYARTIEELSEGPSSQEAEAPQSKVRKTIQDALSAALSKSLKDLGVSLSKYNREEAALKALASFAPSSKFDDLDILLLNLGTSRYSKEESQILSLANYAPSQPTMSEVLKRFHDVGLHLSGPSYNSQVVALLTLVTFVPENPSPKDVVNRYYEVGKYLSGVRYDPIAIALLTLGTYTPSKLSVQEIVFEQYEKISTAIAGTYFNTRAAAILTLASLTQATPNFEEIAEVYKYQMRDGASALESSILTLTAYVLAARAEARGDELNDASVYLGGQPPYGKHESASKDPRIGNLTVDAFFNGLSVDDYKKLEAADNAITSILYDMRMSYTNIEGLRSRLAKPEQRYTELMDTSFVMDAALGLDVVKAIKRMLDDERLVSEPYRISEVSLERPRFLPPYYGFQLVPNALYLLGQYLIGESASGRNRAYEALQRFGITNLHENHLYMLRRMAAYWLAGEESWTQASKNINQEERLKILNLLGLKLPSRSEAREENSRQTADSEMRNVESVMRKTRAVIPHPASHTPHSGSLVPRSSFLTTSVVETARITGGVFAITAAALIGKAYLNRVLRLINPEPFRIEEARRVDNFKLLLDASQKAATDPIQIVVELPASDDPSFKVLTDVAAHNKNAVIYVSVPGLSRDQAIQLHRRLTLEVLDKRARLGVVSSRGVNVTIAGDHDAGLKRLAQDKQSRALVFTRDLGILRKVKGTNRPGTLLVNDNVLLDKRAEALLKSIKALFETPANLQPKIQLASHILAEQLRIAKQAEESVRQAA